jgi:hypothetical protein
MKSTLRRSLRALTVVVAVVCIAPLATAQDDTYLEPRETREALRQLFQDYTTLTPGRADIATRAERLSRSLDELSADQLDVLHRALTASATARAAIERIHANAEEVELEREAAAMQTSAVDPVYSMECGDIRTDAATAKMQLDMWEELQLAAAAAQGECDAATSGDTMQDNVTVCPAAQMANEAAVTARFVFQNTMLCWKDINSAETTAILGTVREIQDEVGAIGGEFQTALDAQTAEIGAAIDAQTGELITAIDAQTAELAAAIAALGDSLGGMLDQVLANQQAILDNQTALLAGQDEIKILLVTPPGRRPGWNGRPNDPNGGNGNGNGN